MALSKEEFGRRFRAARERAHLTQQAVADELATMTGTPVPWRNVQRWDAGKVLPRAERIPQLAEIVGVDAAYLQEPVDEHVVDRTARIVGENAVSLRTALSLLDQLASELQATRADLEQNRRALDLLLLAAGINLPDAQAEAPEIPRYPRRPDEDQQQAPGA